MSIFFFLSIERTSTLEVDELELGVLGIGIFSEYI